MPRCGGDDIPVTVTGRILAIADKLGLPVRFIWIGEGAEDMQEFDANDYVGALLSNGN